MSLDLLVTGDVTLDYVGVVPDFEAVGWDFFDAGVAVKASAGGAASNLACAAADVGLVTGLLANVGADSIGDFVIAQLAGRGVDCRRVTRVTTAPTGIIVIAVDDAAERHTVAFRGANLVPAPLPTDMDLRSIKAVSFMGAPFASLSTQRTMLDLARRARAAGCLILSDAPFPPATDPVVVDSIVRESDVIFFNEPELISLTRLRNVETAIESLRRRTSAVIVTKRGSRGARVDTTTDTYQRAAPVVQAVDSTGAGDAFGAALIAARLRGHSWESALEKAVGAGAIAVQALGSVPRLPHLDRLGE